MNLEVRLKLPWTEVHCSPCTDSTELHPKSTYKGENTAVLFSPQVRIVRHKLALLNRPDNRMTPSTNDHGTFRRKLGTAEVERRQCHQVRESEDHIKQRHGFRHLLEKRLTYSKTHVYNNTVM